jgi:hypothetical protein
MSDPIDLQKKRDERDHRAGEEAHAAGEAFKFRPYVYDDTGIGDCNDPNLPIVVITDPQELEGLAMSRADAVSLATALLVAAREDK